MLNLGGGGVGLLVNPQDRSIFETPSLVWLMLDFRPDLPVPLGVVGRIRHTRIDSMQYLHAGIAFEFGHDREHERFIGDEICRYVAELQRQDAAAEHSNAAP